jgi:hypothetical protein
MRRMRRQLPPVRRGVDYGVGLDTWVVRVPADSPYRAQERTELAAVGSPSAAEQLLRQNLLRHLGAVLITLAFGGGVLVFALSAHPPFPAHAYPATKGQSAMTELKTIRSAAFQYSLTHDGGCPSTSELKEERLLDSHFREIDPWGGLLRIECAHDEMVGSRSDGPDGKPDTEDDIYVPAFSHEQARWRASVDAN